MRFLSLLSAVALPLATFAAKGSGSVFDEFHAKALTSTPIKLNDASYRKLTSAPRDHSVAVVLTALDPRFQCGLCQEFKPDWELVSRNWIKADKKAESRLLFSTLDFSDGRDTFMGLGIQTAPVLLLFQPTTGPHAVPNPEPLRFDFANTQPTAEVVHDWLARNLPGRPHPAFKRPVNWMAWSISIVGGLTLLGLFAKAWPIVLPIIQSRNLWAALSLLGILLFTSGHMFNQIRKVPYVAADNRGGIKYFAPGFQNQFGLETQVIAFLYGLLSFSTIALAIRVPAERNPKIQLVMTVLWGSIMYLVYAFLLFIFRGKNGGYPFKLPPFF